MSRRLAFSIIATLLISSPCAHATPISLTTADSLAGMQISFAALGLKAGASNLNYTIYNVGLPLQSPSWNERELKPNYDWAFELGVRDTFCHGEDVSLVWTHLNNDTSASVTAAEGVFLGPDFQIGPNAIPIQAASGKVKFRYDVVNLEAGQSVNAGRYISMRFFGGLTAGSLREEVNAIYSGTTLTGAHQGPFSTNQTVDSKFSGIGPRVGFAAGYTTDSGFGFVGQAAVSALIGSLNAKTSYVSASQELLDLYNQTSNYQTIKDQSVVQVIPALEGKLGLDYQHWYQNTFITVEAGYQAAVYVNAISQYLPSTLVPGQGIQTGGIFVATMSHTLSNYSVHGPYLKAILRW